MRALCAVEECRDCLPALSIDRSLGPRIGFEGESIHQLQQLGQELIAPKMVWTKIGCLTTRRSREYASVRVPAKSRPNLLAGRHSRRTPGERGPARAMRDAHAGAWGNNAASSMAWEATTAAGTTFRSGHMTCRFIRPSLTGDFACRFSP